MRRKYLLGILSSSLSGLTWFCLDVKVDQEKNGKEGSKKNGEVGTKLNLKGESLCWEGLNDGVHGEGRGRDGSGRDGGDSGLLEVEARFNDLLGNWSSELQIGEEDKKRG